jgi:hypothetical protein
MLVYANSFSLNPAGGIDDVVQQIASWIGSTRKSFVDPGRLGDGIRELRFSDGAFLSSLATLDDQGKPIFPYYFSAKFAHGQPGVPGRRWVTEIGLKQPTADQEILCSILLRTDEISAKVIDPVQVTRPRIVELIANRCKPGSETPGLSIIKLSEGNASAFGYEIERSTRRHPIVEISCDRNGQFPVLPERLRSVLVGLAQVIEIPATANTFRIEETLGRKYSAFGGAINIISPYRATESGGFCKTLLFTPDQLSELTETGLSIESEILAVVTHQTNLPHSWRHISNDSVREALLRIRLEKAASATDGILDAEAYDQLLQEAAEQLASKDKELADARLEIEARDANLDRIAAENDRISAENESLKYNLASVQSRDRGVVAADALSSELVEALKAALEKTPSLEQGLLIVAALYGDRLAILHTAYSSARDSDRGGFQYGAKALEMLKSLADGYWSDLFSGKSDQQARARFGKNGFASKESDTLSDDGKKRRTFRYKDQDALMEMHLKHGVKDSYAETLRIHFEWFPEEKVIAIGHCGKHLDF